MDNIMLLQGNFTSTGLTANIAIPSNVDFMWVKNHTQLTANNASRPVEFYWQRGMLANDGQVNLRNAGATAINASTCITQALGGFTLINQGSTAQLVSAPVAFTAISDATSPVVSTTNTAGLFVGSVVRLSQASTLPPDDKALLGIDFQVSAVNPGASFTIAGPVPLPGAAGTAGFYRIVNISSIFYPQFRYVLNITQAANAVVTTSVNHGYVAGQIVRFNVTSTLNGMTQINQLTATIRSVTANTFTTDLDTTGFTAFAFPTTAAGATPWVPYTPASVDLPAQNTAFSLANNLNTLADASFNTSIIGIALGGGNLAANGVAGPAGAVGDNMFWVAGKSYYNQIGF